ncbi:MAG: type II toxin-antitoxin system VapC family toxin [Chitinophagaceae bacterium]
MVYKIFTDTNVHLDFLLQRGTEWKEAEAIFELAGNKEIETFSLASSLLNLIYIMGTYKIPKKEIKNYGTAILSYTTLINPDNNVFKKALSSAFDDIEDAVQYFTALQVDDIDYFITSNIKDFKKATSSLPVFTPKQFMEQYNK